VTDHRRVRSGIGRRLMTHIFASAEQQGIRTLECFSTLMAEKFYASLGFKTVGPISVNLRQGVTFASIHMRRSL
jgi:N-acetylglutamate synthase-like GNAT family acetyltransferase